MPDGRRLPNQDFGLEIIFIDSLKKVASNYFNDFMDLDIDLNKSENKYNQINLDQCFNFFSNFETLDDKESIECVKCGSKQNMKMKTSITRLPHFLIIQLKRFEKNLKNELQVNFPIFGLDMTPYIENNYEQQPLIYDLVAVSYHIGNLSSGHYFAACKNVMADKWIKFDDANVQEIDSSEIVNRDAYVLFYRRRGLENWIDINELYTKEFVNYEKSGKYLEKDMEEIKKILEEEK